jgi:uncharacterized repeat protein (TIGR03803 family)
MSRQFENAGSLTSGALAVVALIGLMLGNCAVAEAQTYTVLYNFCSQNNCSDGAGSVSGLIGDSSGNLYGTTTQGGNPTCGNGCGVVFKLAPNGTETALHAFDGRDGQYADSSLIMDASGNLFGTTATGGGAGSCNMGCGVAFEIAPNGTETVLHAFSGGNDGGYPSGALIADKKGNLYGLTQNGGANGVGALFKIASNGTETVLYSFADGNDGAYPVGGLIADKKGNLYGATAGGGPSGEGTVFKLAPDGTETVLYAFTGAADGGVPNAGVISDKTGNLYGTTQYDSTFSGVVYMIAPSGVETVLYTFCSQQNCEDGYDPMASLVRDKKGNLYGTTYYAGANGNGGTVFKVTPQGVETTLHSFDAGSGDGYDSQSNLLKVKGTLYGTTWTGGTNQAGTVFSVTK